jgi:hypothetical protein
MIYRILPKIHSIYLTTYSNQTQSRIYIFDVSASGVSMNVTLLVESTIHPPLTDVLLLQNMYLATTEYVLSDREFHRKKSVKNPLCDYRMMRVT